MKRIAFLIGGILLLVTSTAEARRHRGNYGVTYAPAAQVAPARSEVAQAGYNADTAAAETNSAATTTAAAATATTASFSTATAQGVANIMASYNTVGHWGGNPGYEGCGCGATPAAAYAICCYANSGMTTVDVGYAQSKSGMWYCCRRYR